MASKELTEYIQKARDQKVSDDLIKQTLTKQGWPEREVSEALIPNDQTINLPPPPVPHFGMWVTFQYAIIFICLYVSATSLGGVLHHGVNRFFPDKPQNPYSYGYVADDFLLKGYLAGIIVTFPIFCILFIVLKRQLVNKPATRNLKARKQLIYITLVGTFIIMIGHLITTIYKFLGGNTTTNSLLHLGVTFVVAGSIFAYLLNEVREDRKTT